VLLHYCCPSCDILKVTVVSEGKLKVKFKSKGIKWLIFVRAHLFVCFHLAHVALQTFSWHTSTSYTATFYIPQNRILTHTHTHTHTHCTCHIVFDRVKQCYVPPARQRKFSLAWSQQQPKCDLDPKRSEVTR